MQPSDRKRFLGVITGLQEYYSKTLSEAVIQIYWQALSPYDIDAIEQAAGAHMRNPESGQFMPKVADFIKFIEGGSGDRAALAWSKVHRSIKTIGPYQSIKFDDPAIHLVLADMGGFVDLCDVETDQMPFRAREFETRYRSYLLRTALPSAPEKMTGIIERSNRANGYLEHIPETIAIGVDRAIEAIAVKSE